MDLKSIDNAVSAYTGLLPGNEATRLRFFRGVFAIQDRLSQQAAEKVAYPLPQGDILKGWYWGEKPLFLMQPLPIDGALFAEALTDISAHIVKGAGLRESAAYALGGFDWYAFVESTDVREAGYDPTAWLDDTSERLRQRSDAEAPFMVALALSLYPMLNAAADRALGALPTGTGEQPHRRPLRCPVCGGCAAAAYVGPTPLSRGNGRLLYCAQCGTRWEFERLRCARCGTQNQGELHYFHVEGDSAHRLHLCDGCGGYTRTVFKKDLAAPFSFEVEDVVMARLDEVAHDPRFQR